MADETKLGVAQVPIRATLDELDKDLEESRKKIHGSLGDTFASLGGKVAKIGGAAVLGGITAVVGGIAAIGGAAFGSAMKMDEAFDTMAIGSGATGEALEGLKTDFKGVFKDFPGEASTVADVMTGLSSKLGITGQAMQDLARPLAEVTRITGGDAKANTEALTDVMGRWAVKTEDGAGVLDKFFVASQKSGVGIGDLMGKVSQFGTPLQNMGFSLDESIGLLSGLERSGISADVMMAGLKKATVEFTKAGIPMTEGLQGAIGEIKNAGSATEALEAGIAIFGAKAGPEMVNAIQDGKFALTDLTKALGTSEGAILRTADATADWPETWAKIKNTATVALEPLGTALMGVANTVLTVAGPALTDLAEMASRDLIPVLAGLGETFATKVVPVLQDVAEVFGGVVRDVTMGLDPFDVLTNLIGRLFGEEAFGKAYAILGDVRKVFEAVIGFVQTNGIPILAGVGAILATVVVPAFVGWALAAGATALATLAALAPLLLIGAAVGVLAAAWMNDWGGIRTTLTAFWNDTALPILTAVWTWISTTIPPVVAALGVWFTTAWATISTALIAAWAVVLPVLTAIYAFFTVTLPAALTTMATWFATTWATISMGVSTFLTGVLTWFTTTWTAITDWVTTAFNNLVIIFNWAFNLFLSIVKGVLDLILGVFGTSTDEIWATVSGWLNKTWATLSETWTTILNFLTTTWDTIKQQIGMRIMKIQIDLENYWSLISTAVTTTWDTISGFLSDTWDTISETVSSAVKVVWAYLDRYWGLIDANVTSVWKAITGFLTKTWDDLKTKVSETWTGIETAIKTVVKGLWENILERPLSALGTKWEEFWNGIKEFASKLLDGIHISMPHINVSWQDLPVLGHIPSGVSVDWYGHGGEFVTSGPMLIGVGEMGPERVSIEPVGRGESGGSGPRLVLNYYDQRPSGAAPDLAGAARNLEWQASMRGI